MVSLIFWQAPDEVHPWGYDKGLTALSAASPWVFAKQVLRFDGAIVDADIDDQAGEEGAGFEIGATADAQSCLGAGQTVLHTFRGQDIVCVESPDGAITDETHPMPVAVCCFGP